MSQLNSGAPVAVKDGERTVYASPAVAAMVALHRTQGKQVQFVSMGEKLEDNWDRLRKSPPKAASSALSWLTLKR